MSETVDRMLKHKKSSGKWIQKAIQHPGGLHRSLGIPQGQKIPESKIRAAEKRGGRVGRQAHLAETLKHLRG